MKALTWNKWTRAWDHRGPDYGEPFKLPFKWTHAWRCRWNYLNNESLKSILNMKIKVNTRARIVAVYWPKMGAWDFYKILATGKPSEHQPTIIAFTPVFSEAVTTVRNDHKEIPASGWEGRKDDVDPALDRMTWIAHQFKAAIS